MKACHPEKQADSGSVLGGLATGTPLLRRAQGALGLPTSHCPAACVATNMARHPRKKAKKDSCSLIRLEWSVCSSSNFTQIWGCLNGTAYSPIPPILHHLYLHN